MIYYLIIAISIAITFNWLSFSNRYRKDIIALEGRSEYYLGRFYASILLGALIPFGLIAIARFDEIQGVYLEKLKEKS